MTRHHLRHALRLGALTTSIALGAGGAALTLAPPASAAAPTGVNVPCDSPKNPSRTTVQHDDHEFTPAQVKALDAQLHAKLNDVRKDSGLKPMNQRSISKKAALRLASKVTIPVYVHVIHGTHRGDRKISKAQARAAVGVLRNGFRGAQSTANYKTRFYFKVRRIDVTTNDSWYHANQGDANDARMKQRLHAAGKRSLNLYINSAGKAGNVLGYSTFPWQYNRTPRRDGVTVNAKALKGGSLSGYNRGDTAVHETGHWLGLFHTFQNGCSSPGDAVSDTPAEELPSNGCSSFLCTSRGAYADPVHNFMDYAIDSCMYMFTKGQSARMDNEFIAYRK